MEGRSRLHSLLNALFKWTSQLIVSDGLIDADQTHKTGDKQSPSSLRRRFTNRVDRMQLALVNTRPALPVVSPTMKFHSANRSIDAATEVKQSQRSERERERTEKKKKKIQVGIVLLGRDVLRNNRLVSCHLLRDVRSMQLTSLSKRCH